MFYFITVSGYLYGLATIPHPEEKIHFIGTTGSWRIWYSGRWLDHGAERLTPGAFRSDSGAGLGG